MPMKLSTSVNAVFLMSKSLGPLSAGLSCGSADVRPAWVVVEPCVPACKGKVDTTPRLDPRTMTRVALTNARRTGDMTVSRESSLIRDVRCRRRTETIAGAGAERASANMTKAFIRPAYAGHGHDLFIDGLLATQLHFAERPPSPDETRRPFAQPLQWCPRPVVSRHVLQLMADHGRRASGDRLVSRRGRSTTGRRNRTSAVGQRARPIAGQRAREHALQRLHFLIERHRHASSTQPPQSPDADVSHTPRSRTGQQQPGMRLSGASENGLVAPGAGLSVSLRSLLEE